jgi:23S rRNA (adenine2030-N6)-methyltransferase
MLILNELHPKAFREVRLWAMDDARIGVHKRDGLQALVALTPPQIRRGLVVIDPSYEIKSEYTDVPETMRRAFQKWKEGIYFVWYPILADGRHAPLIEGIKTNIPAEILACELMFDRPAPNREAPGLLGTGFVIVNPPWQFDQTMREAGDWLAKQLTSSGRHTIRTLKTG